MWRGEFRAPNPRLLADAEVAEHAVQHLFDIHHSNELVQRQRRLLNLVSAKDDLAVVPQVGQGGAKRILRFREGHPVAVSGEHRLEISQAEAIAEYPLR